MEDIFYYYLFNFHEINYYSPFPVINYLLSKLVWRYKESKMLIFCVLCRLYSALIGLQLNFYFSWIGGIYSQSFVYQWYKLLQLKIIKEKWKQKRMCSLEGWILWKHILWKGFINSVFFFFKVLKIGCGIDNDKRLENFMWKSRSLHSFTFINPYVFILFIISWNKQLLMMYKAVFYVRKTMLIYQVNLQFEKWPQNLSTIGIKNVISLMIIWLLLSKYFIFR